MASVLIDTSAEAAAPRELCSPRRRMVQTTAAIRYIFYLASTEGFVYRKSTDSNATWSAQVDIAATLADEVLYDCYYKRWTDPSFANKVDLYRWRDVGGGGGSRGLYHSQLNLDDDTLTTSTLAHAMGAAGDAGAGGICVARSGRIYMAGGGPGLSGQHMVYSDDEGSNWTVASVSFSEGEDDTVEMWPDFDTADTNDVCAVVHRGGGSPLELDRYDASADTISSVTIDASVTNDFSFGVDMMSAMASNGHIKVAYWDTRVSPANLKFKSVYGSAVTTRTNVLSNTSYGEGVAVAVANTGRIFVFYGRDSAGASETALEVYYKYTDDDGVTWSSETAYGDRDADVTGLLIDPRPLGNAVSPGWFEGASDDLWIMAPPVTVAPTPGTTEPPVVFKCLDGVDGVGVVSFTADGIDVFRCLDVDGVGVVGFTSDSYPLARAT